MHRIAFGEGYLLGYHCARAGGHFLYKRFIVVYRLKLVRAGVYLLVGVIHRAEDLEQPLVFNNAVILKLIGNIAHVGIVDLLCFCVAVIVLDLNLFVSEAVLIKGYLCNGVRRLKSQNIGRRRPCKACQNNTDAYYKKEVYSAACKAAFILLAYVRCALLRRGSRRGFSLSRGGSRFFGLLFRLFFPEELFKICFLISHRYLLCRL